MDRWWQEAGQPRALLPVSGLSVCICFFLESMKLTYFLLGSNSAREEIIATPCCVSLVCGEEKQRSMRWRFGKQHVYGRRGYDSAHVHCLHVDPVSPFKARCVHLCLLAWCRNAGKMAHRFSSLLIDQKSPSTAKFLMLSLWAEKCSSRDPSHISESLCVCSAVTGLSQSAHT